MKEMVDYFEAFPTFLQDQLLPEDKILKLAQFVLPCECQKKLITWTYAKGEGHIKFTGAKKRLSYGEELNTLIALSMTNATKINKRPKAKSTDGSNLENELENFNIEKLNIRAYSNL